MVQFINNTDTARRREGGETGACETTTHQIDAATDCEWPILGCGARSSVCVPDPNVFGNLELRSFAGLWAYADEVNLYAIGGAKRLTHRFRNRKRDKIGRLTLANRSFGNKNSRHENAALHLGMHWTYEHTQCCVGPA